MYTKEELLAIHYTLERVISTEFEHQIRAEQRNPVRDKIIARIIQDKVHHQKANKNMGAWLSELILQEITKSE
jgi:hypothetical protein